VCAFLGLKLNDADFIVSTDKLQIVCTTNELVKVCFSNKLENTNPKWNFVNEENIHSVCDMGMTM
jgi:hypothetical protein